MRIYDYSGLPLTREKLIPGNTPTAISDDVKRITHLERDFYRVMAADLVTNGGMETNDPPDNWTAGDATLASETANRTNSAGTKSIKISATDANGRAYQDCTTVANARYRLRFYYKTTAGDITQYRITNDRAGTEADIVAYTDLAASTAAFTKKDVFFTAVGTATTIYLASKANTDISFFDDVSLYRITDYGFRQGDSASMTSAMDPDVKRSLGKHCIGALVMAEDNSARYTLDASSPSHSASSEPDMGFLLTPTANYWLRSAAEVTGFRVVDAVSGSACKVEVVCYFK